MARLDKDSDPVDGPHYNLGCVFRLLALISNQHASEVNTSEKRIKFKATFVSAVQAVRVSLCSLTRADQPVQHFCHYNLDFMHGKILAYAIPEYQTIKTCAAMKQ